jgi:hypothetical protein
MTNFIVIDLNDIFTDINYIERIRNVYRNLNIPIPTSKESLPIDIDDTYEMGIRYLKFCMNVDKIWLNPINGFIIAYHQDGRGYSFSENFNNHLVNIEPVKITDEILESANVIQTQVFDGEINTDSILDKISKYGIDSLTKEEKSYLDNQ